MSKSREDRLAHDPLGLRWDLERALADPALEVLVAEGDAPNPEAEAAAFRLAVALGSCRLFGIDAGTLDGTLPTRTAIAACAGAIARIRHDLEIARSLAERFDAAIGPEVFEVACAPIEARMNLWAAVIAIDEADMAALERDDPGRPDLNHALHRVLDGLDELDSALRAEKGVLCIACDTDLLTNYRTMLAPEYGEVLPWWLDGTLEAEGKRLVRETEAYLPGPDAWRRLRERLRPSMSEGPETLSFSLSPLSVPPALAAAGAKEFSRAPDTYWRSPDGRFVARLVQPDMYRGAEDPVALSFYDSTLDERAVELAGRVVRFLGVRATVDPAGRVWFTRGQFPDASEVSDPALFVDEQAWRLFDPDAEEGVAGNPGS